MSRFEKLTELWRDKETGALVRRARKAFLPLAVSDVVPEDPAVPLPGSLRFTKSTMALVKASDGSISYADAETTFTVLVGLKDDTSNWTFSHEASSGLTTSWGSGEERTTLHLTAAAAPGRLRVTASRVGHASLVMDIPVTIDGQTELEAAAAAAQAAADAAQAAALAANLRQFATISLVNAATGQYDGEIVYCRENCHLYTWATSGASWSDTSATLPNDPAAYWSADEMPDIPDYAAGTLQGYPLFSSTSVISASSGVSLSIENNRLKLTVTAADWYVQFPALTSILNSTLRVSYSATASRTMRLFATGGTATLLKSQTTDGNNQLIDGYNTVANTRLMLNCTGWTVDDVVYINAEYIGTAQYSTPLLDNSGNGLHGTIYGCTPVAGVSGKGLAFDGVNDYVDFDITKDNWTGAFTRSFWVNGVVRTAIQYLFARSTGSAGGRGIHLYLTESNLPIMIISQDGTAMAAVSAGAGNECTSDCLLTFEFVPSTGMYIYKNGKLIASLTTGVPSLAFWSATQMSRIGHHAWAFRYSGWLDEMSYFKRALSASEVLGLYLAKSLEKRYMMAKYLFDHAADDGYIRPGEKPSILTRWLEIYGNGGTGGTYSQAVTNATAAGVSYTALTTAYNALYAYLYSSPGVLVTAYWQSTITVTTVTYNALWYAYEKELSALAKAVGDAVAAAKAATNAPRYRGIGILAAAATAAFTGATVDTAGAITAGSSVTPNTGDWMVNYSAANVAIGIYFWTGAIWTATTDVRYIDSCTTDLFNLNTGGVSVPGVATIITAIIKNLFVQEIVLLAQGFMKSHDYAEDGNGYPTAGFMLDVASQIIKSYNSKFVNCFVKNPTIKNAIAYDGFAGGSYLCSGIGYRHLASVNSYELVGSFLSPGSGTIQLVVRYQYLTTARTVPTVPGIRYQINDGTITDYSSGTNISVSSVDTVRIYASVNDVSNFLWGGGIYLNAPYGSIFSGG